MSKSTAQSFFARYLNSSLEGVLASNESIVLYNCTSSNINSLSNEGEGREGGGVCKVSTS